jgi:acyl-CoA thioester hydrolase
MRYEITIRPRISETDLLGHINNVAVVAWLEEGRSYMVREALGAFAQLPPFILARIEIDYRAQLFFGEEVQVCSGVERLGNSSLVIRQRIDQRGALCVSGRSVLVHFDHGTQRSVALTPAMREGLGRFLDGWEDPSSGGQLPQDSR